MTSLIMLSIIIAVINAQWLLLEEDSPKVLTTEDNARSSGRRHAALWCFNDDIYMYGGNDGQQSKNDVWKYETENRRWLWQPDVPLTLTATEHTASWEIMGQLYMYTRKTELWMYKPEQRKWTLIVPSNSGIDPGPLYASMYWVHKPSNQLYLYGGVSSMSNQTYSDLLWSYNINSNQWRQVTYAGSGPGPLAHGAAVLGNSEDTVYLFGGETSNDRLNDKLYQLDLSTMTWSTSPVSGTSGPSGRKDIVMWMSPTQEKVSVFGGRAGSEVFGEWWIYDHVLQQWYMDDGSGGPNARWGSSGCRDSKGNFFMFGGTFDDPTYTHNDVWKNGPLTPANILTLLEFKLDAVTLGATVAAVMSTILTVGCFLACLCMACHKCRKYQKYKNSVKLYPPANAEQPFISQASISDEQNE